MARGFIQNAWEIKLLILYILARVEEPIDLPTLTDLALCDEGVDYFRFAEELSNLCETAHVIMRDEKYEITKKGKTNGGLCEKEIPYSVRLKCDQNTQALNTVLRRNNQVRAEITPRGNGTMNVRLCLKDDSGPVLLIEVLAPSEENAQRIASHFKDQPEQVWNQVLSALNAE